MRIEHLGYMVQDPPAVAKWYVEHLGFRVLRHMDQSPFGHFLADGRGRMILEIYNNPKEAVPDYRSMSPLELHLAVVSGDVVADRQRLLAAGATASSDLEHTPQGDVLATLRDPWGFALQLACRAQPLLDDD